jgi:uncharacterized protein with von Willebrand factor type A (vWA) domain
MEPTMELMINLHIEKLPEGVYLATCEDLPGLIAQGRTIQETLREVRRCTQEGIIINTFMLETSHYLLDFVDRMTRMNRGRALYTTPDELGQYVLVDYMTNRTKRVRS